MSIEKPQTTGDEAWYLLQVYPGQEEKIKAKLEQQHGIENLQLWVSQIVVPINEVKDNSERKLFSGWIILKMRMNLKIWNKIRNLPGVTGFVGTGHIPTAFHNLDWKEIPFSRFSH